MFTYYFLLNEKATKGKHAKDKLDKALQSKTIQYRIISTKSHNDSTEWFEELIPQIDKEDIIVACGGDGTINLAVSLLKRFNLTNPLAILPLGSGNDFAKTLNYPTGIKKGLDRLLTINKSINLHILKIKSNQHIYYSINSIGIGIDGRVIHKVSNKPKHIRHFSYATNAVKAFFEQETFSAKLILNGKVLIAPQTYIIVVGNSPYFGGGIKIMPLADPQRDTFHLLYSGKVKTKTFFDYFIRILRKKPFDHLDKIYTGEGHELFIEVHSHQYSQVDGETLGKQNQHFQIEVDQQDFWI